MTAMESSGEIKELNGYHNGSSAEASGENGHNSSKHKHKDKEREKERRKETEEERKIRKEKERREKDEKYKKDGKRPETEEERRIRKEKERSKDKKKDGSGKREETEEERKIRKEKERKEREERHKKEGKREETEEERKIRKEKERKEKEEKHSKREETEEERKIRKEKERKERDESKSSSSSKRKETEEERRIRKEKEKEKERKERKEKENSSSGTKVKEEIKEEVEPSQYLKQEPIEEEKSFKNEPEDDDEEMPLAKPKSRSKASKRKSAFDDDDEDEQDFKEEQDEDEEDEEEYSKPPSSKKKKKSYSDDEYEEEEDFKPKKKTPAKKAAKKPAKKAPTPPPPPAKKTPAKGKQKAAPTPPVKGGRKKKEEPEQTVWKWWEEEKKDDGTKWKFLQHKGPLVAPPYERLPEYVNFYYDGKKMRLSEDAEECATFYGKMLGHDYTAREVFNKNFFQDWRKSMTEKEKEKIRDLSKCDFTEIDTYFKKVSEERKGRSKEDRKKEKEKTEAIQNEYGIAIVDGHEERIGNFRIEPPGLFRGRGEHPKQGMIKRRVQPEDVIINCSKDSEWPVPPPGHKWKEVRHDNTVTWLASWTENIQSQIKYVMLNPSSRLKGEKDMEKYEKARRLKNCIGKIREDYSSDFKSKEMRVRQRSVALYFIDKLALRAGNEKDEDQADTVGCCSLRVEHIKLHEEHGGKEYVIEFDFLGKDSIRYHNFVPIEKRVFKNLQLFVENKKEGDDLFDRLNTTILNEYLSSLMPGLTAKVFRTYNASITLQEQLIKLTDEDDNIPAKMLSYNRANRAVAVLCNHQRAVPKGHDVSMANLQAKIDSKTTEVEKAEKEYKQAKKGGGSAEAEKRKAAVKRLLEQLNRLETQKTDKEENKQIALGTSKLNYLDPRISVAWCKKYDVPLEKVYNKTQREKFRWAIEMTDEDYIF